MSNKANHARDYVPRYPQKEDSPNRFGSVESIFKEAGELFIFILILLINRIRYRTSENFALLGQKCREQSLIPMKINSIADLFLLSPQPQNKYLLL